MPILKGLNKLPGMIVNLGVTVILAYVFYLIISSLLGIPGWSTIKSYFSDTFTFVALLAFLVIAGYGAWRGSGKGSVVFTYITATILIIVVIAIIVFGPDGAKKAYERLQQTANDAIVSFDGTTSEQSTESRSRLDEVHRVGKSGQLISGPDEYVWLEYSPDRCYWWWVVGNPDNRLGMWVTTTHQTNSRGYIKARGWKSTQERPVRINWVSGRRRQDGSCSTL